ncbi:cell division control protein 15 [Lentithecium fluviatile CBS 122367]|uniref:non-specific serine/threonine protein kinase n=1 Tax=Lentithecium fluviatile CBS 122367 TaxID=1168545 RepID=A0A6G1IXW1_9PLEO|nr:cell division control protein 15 [Lentithecium fluviatile CBS 122367]
MEPARLQPPAVGTKARALQQAKEMEELVAERAKRTGDEPPPYDFFELIGKGSYGRVFKGQNRNTGSLVAIKIIDIDKVDYEEMTTKNLSETLKEIDILQQLRDSKARPYVNIIEEARSVHNELWIVSEYASGGSVATLMKPCMVKEPFGLEEKFIIPIARELALGLKYVHEAGVIHRDLKCNNILILEDGRVQLCDFGVSGILEPAVNKRSTIVGTPNWMAPELQKEWVKDANPSSRITPDKILYASEVDIWAYGCTIYEMATGFPPFHRVLPFDLPNSGVPILEGERHSQELKDFVAFVFQTNPRDRPTADEILEHPLLANSVKMYPTVMLVKLVEDYYKWEHEGGTRASLFNPYGAQAPDPLAPEDEDDDDDWTFSTSDEFGNRLSRAFPDPFTAPGQPFTGITAPPDDEDRFAKLQASIKEEAINRAGSRLNRLFDQSLTPYRYSGIDSGGNGRPPSDLILRDFNPGAPNRETVIDLDFAAPTTVDLPSIDLGEVPTLKANRVQKLLREMQMEDEERDSFDQDELTKRATRDWTFPSSNDQSNRRTQDWTFPKANENENRATRDWNMVEEPANRKTQDFRFPPAAPKPNRATREWTFSAAMAEANNQNQRNSRRETKDWTFPTATPAVPPLDNRKTRDFVFPMRPNFSSSPTLGPGFRPSLRHAATEPPGAFDDYPTIISSAPASPLRTSMIDLDMAMVDDLRPSTSGSGSTATYTAGMEQLNENPFNLEDQVHLSQNNNRASYHMKSQSEPNHPIPGLLTPQQYDEQGHPTNQDPHHPSMHARGVSSVSQMQAQVKPQPHNAYHRQNQRSQQLIWDGWSHSAAYALGSDESPPTSVSTDASVDSDIDEAWDNLEKLALSRTRYAARSRRTDSRDEDPRSSDTDDAYTTDATYDDYPRPVRVSVGPNGKPLVDFPIPRGPGVESMLGVDADPLLLQNALWKSSVELRDGLRASRDLLKAMKLEDVKPPLEGFPEEGVEGTDMQGTVRPSRT